MTFLILLLCGLQSFANEKLALGADRLDEIASSLGSLRVALVANQASVASSEHTIDRALRLRLNVVKLFALEHGIRGEGDAGEKLPDTSDPVSGLPVVSLYGEYVKPTRQMLQDVDVIIFDVQDVGVRFYTYISSLGLIMQAAVENGKQVLVLDRPNPNAHRVEGPMMKKKFESFVGKFPIPLVYGLTIGELAGMIRGENWLQTKNVNLKILKLKNYDRTRTVPLVVPPSSGLKTLKAILTYPVSALFEPTTYSVGKGTDDPYAMFGFPDPKAGKDTFIPIQKPGRTVPPKYNEQVCYGYNFTNAESDKIPAFTTDYLRDAIHKFPNVIQDQKFLNLLLGDDQVTAMVKQGQDYSRIRKIFEKDLRAYEKLRKKYLFY